MYKRLMLGLLFGSATLAAAACGSGGGNVTGNNPLNPTTAPSGFVASASPTPAGGTTTASPSPTPGGGTTTASPSPTPGMSVTPSPTPSPTTVATGPTPSPSPTSSGTSTAACTTSTAAASSMNYTLNGAADMITLPPYPATGTPIYTGTSSIPTNSGSNTTLTVKLDTNNFDNVTVPSGQTVDLYTSIELSASTSFGSGAQNLQIPVTINSPCVLTTRTYHVYEFAFGSMVYPNTTNANGAQQNIMPTTAGSAMGFIVDTTNPFPGNPTVADIIITHATGT